MGGYDFTTFKGGKDGVVKSTSHRETLERDQVLLKLTHSGVCGTDAHYKQAPICLGHEGVGTVTEVGPEVTYLKVGDRVGFGYQRSCCGHCEQCLSGHETFCAEAGMYGINELDLGSFATGAVYSEKFLIPIPEKIASEEAAPLMCGGVTVYTVLNSYGITNNDTVGVVGIGGLGHLAIQFASKMGCEVVAFSSGESKREDAMKLGASSFIATKGKDKLELPGGRKISHLVVTAGAIPDWNLYIPILAPRATIYPLAVAPGGQLTVPYMPFVLNGLRMQGSIIGTRMLLREMLDFAARTGVRPVVQKYDFSEKGIDKAFEDLDHGKTRFRGVIVIDA